MVDPGSVPIIGVGSLSEPPALRRKSSIARSALRAARPTSSIRVFSPSSSSITVNGITIAQFGKLVRQFGSAIKTEVSSTTREPTGVAKRSANCSLVFSEIDFEVDNETKCCFFVLNDGGWVEPKVLLRGRIYGIFKNLFKISFSGRKIIWMGEFFAGEKSPS